MQVNRCPEFPFFGARYPDATCIDGYLWDLDSCESSDILHSGGDVPCPFCNTEAFIEYDYFMIERDATIAWVNQLKEKYNYKASQEEQKEGENG